MVIKKQHYFLLMLVGIFGAPGLCMATDEQDKKEQNQQQEVKQEDTLIPAYADTSSSLKEFDSARECIKELEEGCKKLEDGLDLIKQIEACQDELSNLSNQLAQADTMNEMHAIKKRIDSVRATIDELERKAQRWGS